MKRRGFLGFLLGGGAGLAASRVQAQPVDPDEKLKPTTKAAPGSVLVYKKEGLTVLESNTERTIWGGVLVAGERGRCRYAGLLELNHNWEPGDVLYLGPNGKVSATIPTNYGHHRVKIGVALPGDCIWIQVVYLGKFLR